MARFHCSVNTSLYGGRGATISHFILSKIVAEFAVTQPQASYVAYTFGLKHQWAYFLRTLPDIQDLHEPLEIKHSIPRSHPCHYRSAMWPIGKRHTGSSSPFGRTGHSKPFQ